MERFVHVDPEALLVAVKFVRWQKELAIDQQDFDASTNWRDEENRLVAAQAKGGVLEVIPDQVEGREAELSSENFDKGWRQFVKRAEIVPQLLF